MSRSAIFTEMTGLFLYRFFLRNMLRLADNHPVPTDTMPRKIQCCNKEQQANRPSIVQRSPTTGNAADPLSAELLDQLRKIDTPTIANALELMDYARGRTPASLSRTSSERSKTTHWTCSMQLPGTKSIQLSVAPTLPTAHFLRSTKPPLHSTSPTKSSSPKQTNHETLRHSPCRLRAR